MMQTGSVAILPCLCTAAWDSNDIHLHALLRSKHWREDGLPCLRPTEQQMLPVFERWAHVVALAEVGRRG